jgi:hypothetical protein
MTPWRREPRNTVLSQLEHSPDKDKTLLYEVTKVMNQHQLLEEKLVEHGLEHNNGTDTT